ncbi:hypothetical protein M1146_07650 [Patescibacteria group bacterium]|nr:hypothetical protein [Patescibacteria group bacterium]
MKGRLSGEVQADSPPETEMMEEMGNFGDFIEGYFIGYIPLVGGVLAFCASKKLFFKLGSS